MRSWLWLALTIPFIGLSVCLLSVAVACASVCMPADTCPPILAKMVLKTQRIYIISRTMCVCTVHSYIYIEMEWYRHKRARAFLSPSRIMYACTVRK